jgi:N-acylneuraminate cytidylyltransferase
MGSRVKPIVEHKITGVDIDEADDFELVDALISIRPRPAFLKKFVHDPA